MVVAMRRGAARTIDDLEEQLRRANRNRAVISQAFSTLVVIRSKLNKTLCELTVTAGLPPRCTSLVVVSLLAHLQITDAETSERLAEEKPNEVCECGVSVEVSERDHQERRERGEGGDESPLVD